MAEGGSGEGISYCIGGYAREGRNNLYTFTLLLTVTYLSFSLFILGGLSLTFLCSNICFSFIDLDGDWIDSLHEH